jgi:hypothetical protein
LPMAAIASRAVKGAGLFRYTHIQRSASLEQTSILN